MRLALVLIAVMSLIHVSARGQCTASYSDGSVDDANTTFSAWTTVTDYYGQSGACQMNWGLTFYHSYTAAVGIQSPTGRSATYTVENSSVPGGGGSASAYASLAISDEEGTYYLIEQNQILCSIAGTMLLTSVTSPFYAFGKTRTNYGFDSDFGGCAYHKSCSPSRNHWAGDSYTSTFANNKSAGVCWNYLWKYHAFIKVGSLRRYWSITNENGESWVGRDGWEECDALP